MVGRKLAGLEEEEHLRWGCCHETDPWEERAAPDGSCRLGRALEVAASLRGFLMTLYCPLKGVKLGLSHPVSVPGKALHISGSSNDFFKIKDLLLSFLADVDHSVKCVRPMWSKAQLWP